MARKHYSLKVWQEAISLVEEVYNLTKQLPNSERFGLTDQMRRAVVSVPSNIAEGAGRETPKEFLRFLYIARGSLSELDTQVVIVKRLAYSEKTQVVEDKMEAVFKLLSGLISNVAGKCCKST